MDSVSQHKSYRSANESALATWAVNAGTGKREKTISDKGVLTKAMSAETLSATRAMTTDKRWIQPRITSVRIMYIMLNYILIRNPAIRRCSPVPILTCPACLMRNPRIALT